MDIAGILQCNKRYRRNALMNIIVAAQYVIATISRKTFLFGPRKFAAITSQRHLTGTTGDF